MAASPAPVAPPGLRLHLLGGFHVAVDGRLVEPSVWRLRHAATLVKLLALAPGHHLHRERLARQLWPASPPSAAAGSLKYALHVARRALRPAPTAPAGRWLTWQGDLLALGPTEAVWTDVAAFETAAAIAHRAGDPAAVRDALALYTGDLLPEDADADWPTGRREALRQERLALLLGLAELEAARGDPAAAIATLTRAVAAEPSHEEAHRRLMRLYAQTGRLPLALRQFDQASAALRRDLDAEPDQATRDLRAAILVGEVAASPALADDPPLPIPQRRTTNLPAALTSFVGRERELAEVARLLVEARLLTLTGAGGVGKTRLALEAARAAQADYPDGVWLVELAALADPQVVPSTVARALEIMEQPGRSVVDTLAAWLATRRLLLVLDNCDHLLDVCAHLASALLRAGPGLRILATSRERLNIAGEMIWRVPSLALPDAQAQPDPKSLAGNDAIRLFVERARAVASDFALTETTAPAVARICRQLDGIPLALELAAARLSALSAEQLAARLEDRLRLLTGGSRTAPPRQQTLRATIDWSFDLLADPERVLLRRLAVFAGGWTVEAAEAVCGGDGLDAADVLDVMTRLVDKSLVLIGDGESRRYRMLETIRQYAWERLCDAGEEVATRDRHLAWCLGLAERAEPHVFEGAEQLAWLARLDAEHDDLRAALAWSANHEPEAGLRLAGHLWQFWKVRGHHTEGRRWLDSLLQRSDEPDLARVKALLGAGALARAGLARYLAMARERLTEAAALGRTLGATKWVAFALRELALTMQALGDGARSDELLAEALAAVRAAGDRRGLGITLVGQHS